MSTKGLSKSSLRFYDDNTGLVIVEKNELPSDNNAILVANH